MISVAKVIKTHGYMMRELGIKRFKLSIIDSENIHVSKKSYPLQKDLIELTKSYVSNSEQYIEGFLIEKGCKYKIGDKRYASNYLEVVLKVNQILGAEGQSLHDFMANDSRICSDKNSRDRNVVRMSNLLITE